MSHLFHWSEYIKHQSQVLLDCFSDSGGTLEVTGEFLQDKLFMDLLPGYEKNSQITIIKQLIDNKKCTVSYCINAKDVVRDKQLSKKYLSFEKYILKQLALIKFSLWVNPQVIITMLDKDFIPPHIRELEELIRQQGYTSSHFYLSDIYQTEDNTVHLLTSYGEKTGKSTIAHSSGVKSHLYSSLPIAEYNNFHPLNIVSNCYQYNTIDKDTENTSLLSAYIKDPKDITLQVNCTKKVQERLEYYETLYLSWHAEEEQVEEIQSNLTTLLAL